MIVEELKPIKWRARTGFILCCMLFRMIDSTAVSLTVAALSLSSYYSGIMDGIVILAKKALKD